MIPRHLLYCGHQLEMTTNLNNEHQILSNLCLSLWNNFEVVCVLHVTSNPKCWNDIPLQFNNSSHPLKIIIASTMHQHLHILNLATSYLIMLLVTSHYQIA